MTEWRPNKILLNITLEEITFHAAEIDRQLNEIKDWPASSDGWLAYPELLEHMETLMYGLGTLFFLDKGLSWQYHDCLGPLADCTMRESIKSLEGVVEQLGNALKALESVSAPEDRAVLCEEIRDLLALRDTVETILNGRLTGCLAPVEEDILRPLKEFDAELSALLGKHGVPEEVKQNGALAWCSPKKRSLFWWYK